MTNSVGTTILTAYPGTPVQFVADGKMVTLSADAAILRLVEGKSTVSGGGGGASAAGKPVRPLLSDTLEMQHATWFNNTEQSAIAVQPAEWENRVLTCYIKTEVPVSLSGVSWLYGVPFLGEGYIYVIALQQIDAANILEKNHICDAEDFIFYFNSGGFGIDFEERLPSDSSLKFQKMEGYLFPDTYFFYENSKPEEVCQKIYYNFDTKMNGEFSTSKKEYATRYERMEELDLTLDELITIASIVQKEAANVKDMNDVAAVFRNRIENNDVFPKLQSDPTKNYSNNTIRPNIEYYNQTIIDAYDTYKSAGLPPGAISNPGLDAIDAVLTNKKTKNFYFIANIRTNKTFFSETLEEHEAKEAEIKQYYIDNPVEEE